MPTYEFYGNGEQSRNRRKWKVSKFKAKNQEINHSKYNGKNGKEGQKKEEKEFEKWKWKWKLKLYKSVRMNNNKCKIMVTITIVCQLNQNFI